MGADAAWALPDAYFVLDLAVVRPSSGDARPAESPLLVVEILSPSTRHIDLGRKRELYAAGGLSWYWLVDLVHDELIAMRSDGTGRLAEVERFTSGTTSAPLQITLDVRQL